MDAISPYFGTVDYCVFAIMLLVSIGIGIYMSIRGSQSPEEFLMGNRSFHPIPIAMSLLTSIVSSISLLGYSGEVYLYGLQFTLFLTGTIFGITAAKHVTLPVLFPLKLTSVNEYIEIRFKSKALRSLIMVMVTFAGLVYLGICLYAPTLALSAVTPFSSRTYIFLLGGICTLYSSIGGIKAVVWTDVFQLTVMLVGMSVIVALGCINLGGIVKVWTIAAEGGRLNLFNMNPSLYERHNFYNVNAFGFYFFFSIFGVSQINVQRICSVKTIEAAKKVLNYNIFGMLLIYSLVFTAGLIGYATYADCDPLASGKIERGEQIVSYFVVNKLGHIWGLPGLFVATLIGGTLSSLSSVINALVAQVWKDGFLRFQRFQTVSPSVATIINKCISLVIGILLIGFALLTSRAQNLAQFTNTVSAAIYGPVVGVFLLGFLFPRSNSKGVWCGLITSYVLVCWLTIGSFYYGTKAKHLPFSTEMCDNFTQSVEENSTYFNHTFSSINGTTNLDDDEVTFAFPMERVYKVSYTLLSIVGPIVCITIGMFVSAITGLEDLSSVNPQLISPFIRKWHWGKTLDQKQNLLQHSDDHSFDVQPVDLKEQFL